ncbi:Afadin [Manis pentadactyla]|nr:Afadin [Manis pentadactyla]
MIFMDLLYCSHDLPTGGMTCAFWILHLTFSHLVECANNACRDDVEKRLMALHADAPTTPWGCLVCSLLR